MEKMKKMYERGVKVNIAIVIFSPLCPHKLLLGAYRLYLSSVVFHTGVRLCPAGFCKQPSPRDRTVTYRGFSTFLFFLSVGWVSSHNLCRIYVLSVVPYACVQGVF